MSNYLFHGYELPPLPNWDKTTYPYAHIAVSSDKTINVLWVLNVPLYIWTDEEGTHYGTKNVEEGIGLVIGYYKLSSDKSTWSSFVRANPNDYSTVNGSEGINVVWANHDILDYDSGLVYLSYSEPVSVEGTTYLYNGRRLPILPDWDMDKFPYVLIITDTDNNTTAYITEKPLMLSGNKLMVRGNWATNNNKYFSYMSCSITAYSRLGFYENLSFTYVSSTSYLNFYSYSSIVWSNYDVTTGLNGELVSGKSRPVDSLTGKETFFYDIPQSKFYPPSLLKGVDIGRRLKNKRPVKIEKVEDTDPGLSHEGTIPEGGTYYRGVTGNKTGDYSTATSTLTAGSRFPENPEVGDCYVFGDYEYRYSMYLSYLISFSWYKYSIINDSWGVAVIDRTKESYEEPLSAINGRNIFSISYLFRGCTALTKSPKLPRMATNCSYTFYGCTALTDVSEVVFSNRITAMSYTFSTCSSLVDASGVVLPTNVQSMESTFGACSSLVKVPELKHLHKLTKASYIFAGCSSLVSAPEFPGSVLNLDYAFSKCSSLKYAKIPSGVFNLDYTFQYCTSLEETPDMSNLVNISTMCYTFYGCTSLKKINNLPKDVVSLYSTFRDCSSLVNVDLGNLKQLLSMYYCFYGCTSLKTVGIPDNVISLYSTFSDCISLTRPPKLPKKLINMYNIFSGCTGLTDLSSFVIPDGVYSMTQAFQRCTGLIKFPVSIPDSVISISHMFNGCTSLKEPIVIPPNVTDTQGLFKNCTSLEDITGFVIPNRVRNAGYIFENCSNAYGTVQVNMENVANADFSYWGNTKYFTGTKSIRLKGTGTKANTSILNHMVEKSENENVTIVT